MQEYFDPKKNGETVKNGDNFAENQKFQVFILNFKERHMKKTNNLTPKLKLKKVKILVLSPEQMINVAAGENTSLVKPSSFDCIPPYNAVPYLTQKYCY